LNNEVRNDTWWLEVIMPRAFWKGVISFGMVAIPVKMYTATETKAITFHILHKKCLTRTRQVIYCPTDNEYLDRKDTARGYEFTKGRYVVLTDDDFSKIPLKTAHAINILRFVDETEIDPTYYSGSHYLEPEELGAKPFRLLSESLRKTGLVGIAKVVLQRREHLCCLRPHGEILALHTMRFKDEIVPADQLVPSKAEVTAEELNMAVSLIKVMVGRFQPENYRDEYQSALKQIVEAKVRGEKIAAPVEPKIEIGDLMASLRASIDAARKEPAGAPR
jgi:DNA end-binding protein Ku